MTCSRGAIYDRFKRIYSDMRRDRLLGLCYALITPPEPTASIGARGVPNKVYKNCLKLLHQLWRALKVIWRRGKIIPSRRCAEGVLIQKEDR